MINLDFCTDEEERELMDQIFEFAREMISMNLVETELALLCAVVLIDSGMYVDKCCLYVSLSLYYLLILKVLKTCIYFKKSNFVYRYNYFK